MRRLPKEIAREIREDGLFDAAASVAFWLLLSLPAALLAALSAVSLLGDELATELRDAMLEFVDRVFTSEADTLRASIEELFVQTRPALLSLSIATAVFTLSRGFAGLIRALDVVYDIEETRNFAHTRMLAVGLAVGTLITIAGSTALWSYGKSIGGPLPLPLIGATAVLVVWSATMYHVGPNHHTPWRYDLPGAILAAMGWLLLSLGFGWYVRLIGTGGNEVLGAAGALLLGLTWLWAACVLFLIGGELNEILAARAGVIQENKTVLARLRDLASDAPGADDSTAEDDAGRDHPIDGDG